MKNTKISVVFPVFNEENNLNFLYERVKEACRQSGVDYEMIFVDDGSTDNSLKIMKDIRNQDKKVAFISLSRNFGHQNALFAGMGRATGEAVVTMDADLQHPPFLIPKMVDLWRQGYEVVYTVKKSHKVPFITLLLFKIFYRVISRVSGIKLSFGQSDFRLLDRKVLNAIVNIPEYHKFLRGQVEWVGFKQYGLSYEVDERYSGKSKLSYSSRFSFAMDGIFAFSNYPLHLVMLLGAIVAVSSLSYMVFLLMMWILDTLNIIKSPVLLPGWLTLAVSIFFLGGIQLIAIAIIGEYVGRTYDQTKGRPLFIVKESSKEEEGIFNAKMRHLQ